MVMVMVDDDHDDNDDDDTSFQHPAGFSQLITLGAVSVSQHNGFGANDPKQTSTKLTSVEQTLAAPAKFATLRFRNSDATRSELCLRSAALCAVCRCVWLVGWVGGAN